MSDKSIGKNGTVNLKCEIWRENWKLEFWKSSKKKKNNYPVSYRTLKSKLTEQIYHELLSKLNYVVTDECKWKVKMAIRSFKIKFSTIRLNKFSEKLNQSDNTE